MKRKTCSGSVKSSAPATVTSIVNRKNKVMAASAALTIDMEEAIGIEQKRLESDAAKKMEDLQKMRDQIVAKRDALDGDGKNSASSGSSGIARIRHQRIVESYDAQIAEIDAKIRSYESKAYLTEFFSRHLEYMNVYMSVKKTPKTIAQIVSSMLKIRSDVLIVQSPSEVPLEDRVYCFKDHSTVCVACAELTRAHEVKRLRDLKPWDRFDATAPATASASKRRKKKSGAAAAASAVSAASAAAAAASMSSIGHLSTAHLFFEHEGERFCKQHCMFKKRTASTDNDKARTPVHLVDVYTYSQRAHLYMEKLDRITSSLAKIVMAALVEDFRASCAGCTCLGAAECVKYAYINFVQLHKQHNFGLFQLSLNSAPGQPAAVTEAAANRSTDIYSSSSGGAAVDAVANSVLCTTFEQVDTCTVCNIPLVLVSAQSVLVCTRCGRSDVFLDCMNIISTYDKENESATQYKRIGHLETQLTCMQAKDTKAIPKEVIVQILYVLCVSKKVCLPGHVPNDSDGISEHATDKITNNADATAAAAAALPQALQQGLRDQLDKSDIRYALKILNLRRYYDNAPRILMMMTGERPPQMTATQEDRIRQRFRAIQTPVDRHCPPGRSSFVPYFYIIYKICQMEFWPEFLPHCKLPKKIEKRQQTDRIWKIFCEELDGEDPSLPWEFYKTPPPAPPAPSPAYLLQQQQQ